MIITICGLVNFNVNKVKSLDKLFIVSRMLINNLYKSWITGNIKLIILKGNIIILTNGIIIRFKKIDNRFTW